MRKLIIVLGLLVCMISISYAAEFEATCASPKVTVLAVDGNGNPLEGVVVAPESKFIGGWNDFFPKEKTTGADGKAGWNNAVVYNGKKFQVNYATIDGYTCTRGEMTRVTATSNSKNILLKTVCTKDNEVPEFTTLGAGIALLGACAVYMFRKR